MADHLTLSLSTDFGYVLVAIAVLAIEVFLIGFIMPGRIRGKVFTKEFMEKNFGSEHKDAFN